MILKYHNKMNQFYNIRDVAKNYFHMSDKLIVKLKQLQRIKWNGSIAKIDQTLFSNDIVEFDLNYEEESQNIIPTPMNLDIIFEDEALLIINKKPNCPVHPSINHYEDSLSNGVKYYFNQIHLKKKIRPINRLDKDTSGLVMFAKNEYIQEQLIYQMKVHQFQKKYIGVLEGILPSKAGIISAPIARKPGSIIEREVNFENGQAAITSYQVLQEKNGLSLVAFELTTGRTHQIRVHSKYLGCPLLGDTLYHRESNLINRQALHAKYISFFHPITKKKMSFETDIPKDIQILFDT